ncbi:MAG: radical SAM family heme chaperone HemW [Alloprevotella sp.]
MLYLHIPFCQSRCIYCDFYSTTGTAALRSEFVRQLCRELEWRKDYLPQAAERASASLPDENDGVRQVSRTGRTVPLSSVYWGGGTPSQLHESEIETLFDTIHRHYTLLPEAEVTFEANPDDITPELVSRLRSCGVNRVSLGVQSFSDSLLQLLHRRHSAARAVQAVETLYDGGISNLSIDLIYGLPGQTLQSFRSDCQQALSLPVTHLSSYALSVEPHTPLSRMIDRGQLQPADEDLFLAQYEVLLDATAAAGYEHYEISNFCRPGFRARHNSGYWKGVPYLGVGPGAHSFDLVSRRANSPDLHAYIQAADSDVPHETEQLTRHDRINELIFTSLRTSDGLDLARVEQQFGPEVRQTVARCAQPHLRAQRLEQCGTVLRLTRSGLFVSDSVMSDLMLSS